MKVVWCRPYLVRLFFWGSHFYISLKLFFCNLFLLLFYWGGGGGGGKVETVAKMVSLFCEVETS